MGETIENTAKDNISRNSSNIDYERENMERLLEKVILKILMEGRKNNSLQ